MQHRHLSDHVNIGNKPPLTIFILNECHLLMLIIDLKLLKKKKKNVNTRKCSHKIFLRNSSSSSVLKHYKIVRDSDTFCTIKKS